MRRHPIYTNASLLRELRLISQQFFQSRRDQAFWSNNPGPKARETQTQKRIWCAVCLRNPSTKLSPNLAITISRGDAVCDSHLHA